MQTTRPPLASEIRNPCPVCAADASEQSRYHAPHNQIQYTLNHCDGCGLEFWSPLKMDPSIYSDDGFAAYVDYHAGRRPFPHWAKPLFTSLHTPPSRALDIGCGDGAVMKKLQELGTEVRGIDLDPQSVRVADGRCGIGSCTVSTLDDFVVEQSADVTRFDLVTFFEVLEHQVDPRAFLSQVTLIAASGAMVAGSVPNRDRFLANTDRLFDSGDMPPHHFLRFSSDSLRSTLELAGFRDIRIQRTGAMDLAETFRKMHRLIQRHIQASIGLPRTVSAAAAWLVAPLPSLGVWIGRRVRPSHLFFCCKK